MKQWQILGTLKSCVSPRGKSELQRKIPLRVPNGLQMCSSEYRVEHGFVPNWLCSGLEGRGKEGAGEWLVGSDVRCSLQGSLQVAGASKCLSPGGLVADPGWAVAVSSLRASGHHQPLCCKVSQALEFLQDRATPSEFHQQCMKIITMKAEDHKPNSPGGLHLCKQLIWPEWWPSEAISKKIRRAEKHVEFAGAVHFSSSNGNWVCAVCGRERAMLWVNTDTWLPIPWGSQTDGDTGVCGPWRAFLAAFSQHLRRRSMSASSPGGRSA